MILVLLSEKNQYFFNVSLFRCRQTRLHQLINAFGDIEIQKRQVNPIGISAKGKGCSIRHRRHRNICESLVNHISGNHKEAQKYQEEHLSDKEKILKKKDYKGQK